MATEGVKGAIADFVCFLRPLSPPQRRNPLLTGKSRYVWKTSNSVAPIWRDNVQVVERAAWGARLRTREVTGRDASLPAPLLSAFGILVARGTVGALPQTPQGTLSLDPARGRRKGTKSPLDPFRAIELVTLSCFFRVFILLFTLYFNLSANEVAPNRSGSPSHSAHVAPISA